MNFNDEIVSIEVLDDEDMIDIEVSDDHLFYGDGVLVSNSIGIPGVCDFLLAVTRNEEMDTLGQVAIKQLKNRYRSLQYKPRFVLGVDFEKQLLYDVNESEQDLVANTVDFNDHKTKFKREIDFGDYE